jgi:hypothetical protein
VFVINNQSIKSFNPFLIPMPVHRQTPACGPQMPENVPFMKTIYLPGDKTIYSGH